MSRSGMKMADLTRESGISTASIKFYLREGLLHPGTRTAPNQAVYDASHLRRLRLIRALRDVGGVSIASIRQAISAIEQPEQRNLIQVLGSIADALGEANRTPPVESPERSRASTDLDAFLDRVGLPRRKESPAREALIGALLAFRAIDPRVPTQILEPYVEALRGLAAWEVAQVIPPGRSAHQPPPGDAGEVLEGIIYGTMLLEPVILAIRRLLHEQFTVGGVRAEDLPAWAGQFEPKAGQAR